VLLLRTLLPAPLLSSVRALKMATGPPRLDAYLRLIARFFEAVIVLFILGRVQGPHLTTPHDASSNTATRRRFLRNLCSVCDYAKGGPSTTAIAVENCQDCIKFWVASNEGPSAKVISFLDSVLSLLRRMPGLTASESRDKEVELLSACTTFASMRLKKLCKALSTTAARCRKYLEEHPEVDGMTNG
jgi:hypothetical protein